MKEISKTPEILVVDDDILGAANDYARIIYMSYKLHVASAKNSDEAIDIIKKYHIKVVVLDQMMPDMKGTDLYKKIKKLSPDIKAIMFTGEASSDDTGEAINLGFNSYLPKGKVDDLPHVVLDLYTKYEKEMREKAQLNTIIQLPSEKKYWIFTSAKYSVVSMYRSNDTHIFPKEWETKSTLNAGEGTEKEYIITYENRTVLDEEIERKVKSELSISDCTFAKMKSSINTELTARSKKKYEEGNSVTKRIKVTEKLPSHLDDSDQDYILKRDIEVTPIYNEYRIIIKKECPFCDHTQIYPLTIYKQTRAFMTRQVTYRRKSGKETNETGPITL